MPSTLNGLNGINYKMSNRDLEYYKKRALKAESLLLETKKDAYIDRQMRELQDVENECSNKMRLYSYSEGKMASLAQELSSKSDEIERRIKLAKDIYLFNVKAINEGKELHELPDIEKMRDIELNYFQLPRSPTPGSPPGLTKSHDKLTVDNVTSHMRQTKISDGGNSSLRLAHNEGYSQTASDSLSETASVDSNMATTSKKKRKKKKSGNSVDDKDTVDVTTAQNAHEYIKSQPENPPAYDEVAQLSNVKEPAVGAGVDFNRLRFSNPSSSFNRMLSEPCADFPHDVERTQVDGEAMGLDTEFPLPTTSTWSTAGFSDLPVDSKPISQSPKPATWSNIASAGDDNGWNTVAKKKPAPKLAPAPISSTLQQPPRLLPVSAQPQFMMELFPQQEASNRFEKMVRELMHKYGSPRNSVIEVLRVVRDHSGDIFDSRPLEEIMMDAERVISARLVPKTSSLSTRAKEMDGHLEPCDNQLCPVRLKSLKYKTEMCMSYQTTRTCQMREGLCVYAHGPSELRPLPKLEICERYLEGRCQNPRCVYAHGRHELRNAPTFTAADYLNQKLSAPVKAPTRKPRENLELTDEDRKGPDECAICLETMSKASRQTLDCGHDGFHYKCLKKWVAGTEGTRSCPMCRSNTLLPEEYPKLGK